MEPQAHVNKLEVLEALTEVKTEYPPPHTGPPHAHGDAVSSLAGLAVPGPGLAAGAAWPLGHPCRCSRCCCSHCCVEADGAVTTTGGTSRPSLR